MRLRHLHCGLLSFALFCGVAWADAAGSASPPAAVYGDLFDAVQRARLFPDSKTFADAVPKQKPEAILAAWREARDGAGFDLRAFVSQHFEIPEVRESLYRSDERDDVCAHIEALWPVLTREPDKPVEGSSLLPLPHRYVVPGGRFREVYYWDSYFTMLGLEKSRRHDLVDDMVANFAHLIETRGHIPNGNRTYYLSRSQPPFFAAMLGLVAAREGDAIYARYLDALQREHAFWMDGAQDLARGAAHRRVVRLSDGTTLNRYWDDRPQPRDEAWAEDLETAARSGRNAAVVYRNLRAAAESGWDFSSRWLADGRTLATIRTTEYLPVDLNSLLHELEQVIARGHAARGDTSTAETWRETAAARADAMRKLFWNPKRRAFTDYHWTRRELSDQVTAAGMFPLFFGIATAGQAREAAGSLRLTLLRPEGIVPTTKVTGQQWDAPNGWAPLQWMAISGLWRYGETDLAAAIQYGWVREVTQVFRRTGKLVEKYDVTGDDDARGGEYPNQDGFGWTNGVFSALACH